MSTIHLQPCEMPTPVSHAWHVQHGIAGCITAVATDGQEWTAIREGAGHRWYRGTAMNHHVEAPPIPPAVETFVRDRFAIVFAMPLDQRGFYCSHSCWHVIPVVRP